MLHLLPVPEPAPGIDKARAEVKECYRLMMNAARRTAGMFAMLARDATDPQAREAFLAAEQAWHNSASNAWKEMKK